MIPVPSPNFDDRPDGTTIDCIVIHGISLPQGEFGAKNVLAFFQNKLDFTQHPSFDAIKDLKVSAHFFIDRMGQIYQLVAIDKRAWHAGQSMLMGKENVNHFSIGIELEGTDDILYTHPQYVALANLVSKLKASLRAITLDRVVGHSDIAPLRKTDPGPAFDWDYFRQLLDSVLSL